MCGLPCSSLSPTLSSLVRFWLALFLIVLSSKFILKALLKVSRVLFGGLGLQFDLFLNVLCFSLYEAVMLVSVLIHEINYTLRYF